MEWQSTPKGHTQAQDRKGVVKRIYPDGWLLLLGRRGKTRIDPRTTPIHIASSQTPRFLHGDKVQHATKGYGVFIHYEKPRKDQCWVAFGDPEVVRQTSPSELVESVDVRFHTT